MSDRRIERVDRPGWARESTLRIEELSGLEMQQMKGCWHEILRVFDESVGRYLRNDDFVFDSGQFPNWERLTGEYYIGDESYYRREDSCVVSLMAHCTEKSWARNDGCLVEHLDYLGLQVGLNFNPLTSRCTPGFIDASAI